jgi:DNA modification methylase
MQAYGIIDDKCGNQRNGIPVHPARFPAAIPEYFIRMLTDTRELVFTHFRRSCVTGEVCERLERRWICSELVEDYRKGALAKFDRPESGANPIRKRRIVSSSSPRPARYSRARAPSGLRRHS